MQFSTKARLKHAAVFPLISVCLNTEEKKRPTSLSSQRDFYFEGKARLWASAWTQGTEWSERKELRRPAGMGSADVSTRPSHNPTRHEDHDNSLIIATNQQNTQTQSLQYDKLHLTAFLRLKYKNSFNLKFWLSVFPAKGDGFLAQRLNADDHLLSWTGNILRHSLV